MDEVGFSGFLRLGIEESLGFVSETPSFLLHLEASTTSLLSMLVYHLTSNKDYYTPFFFAENWMLCPVLSDT